LPNYNTIRIETLGCRLNQIESEGMSRFFLSCDFLVDMSNITSSSAENEDVVLCVVNTCTVTQKAEQKARRIIRLLLTKCPNAAVLVTGCYAQLSPEKIKQIDERICVIGGQIKSRIAEVPQLIKKYFDNLLEKKLYDPVKLAELIDSEIGKTPQEKPTYPENSFKLSATSLIAHSRASLKIQDGCNNNCSYCAIHMARGHSVSIDVETAIERVKQMEKEGQSEVVLTTVNISQYHGKYKNGYCNFSKLLKILLENTDKINFRISSLYPEIVDDEFCAAISDKRVRPHFHISVQTGSDKILRLMNRTYTAFDVANACRKLRQAKTNPFIACDIITGFPGETDEDFEQTMKLCELCDFSWVHAFVFSERPGTPAANMKNKVAQVTADERSKRVTAWAIKNKIKYIENFINAELDAIFETVKRPAVLSPFSSDFIYHAVTENFIHCEIHCQNGNLSNQQHRVKILKTLSEKISKGGEIEAAAELLNSCT